jgi:uncharacterized membrane protein HdeD (DUF308 family)
MNLVRLVLGVFLLASGSLALAAVLQAHATSKLDDRWHLSLDWLANGTYTVFAELDGRIVLTVAAVAVLAGLSLLGSLLLHRN